MLYGNKTSRGIYNYPKCTDDWFLKLIQGSCLDIANEKQWERSIKSLFRQGEEVQIYGFMNFPNNLKCLLLLNLNKCKIHIDRRCGLLHLSEYHEINFYDIPEKVIINKPNTDMK
ncbi:unnamed protein product (macronuclear) [Paramecium tetraurelia]|uniref:Uncharacterized protein n=1 Tax=Paramecium tetraurelia TaxID=5888 RepID=A0E6P2_PARTE|nr:uncharacterized protein GSPATT00003824001 [Paramecium tetraurelia]CAK90959.1 unnamed protein product [Paramecium tetraurelia]|eukprot:XP_001458356.1 hypothetical protein (macronuclear) [Paramecium tetraurelia strain d4-2]